MTYPIAVACQGVTVRLGDHTALEGVTFELPRQSFCAIIGPNGGGKTTLLKVLLGLIPPTEGTVEVMGEIPTRVSPALVGYVPQVKTLDRTFPARAEEVVVTGVRRRWPMLRSAADRELARDSLKRVGAEHLIDRPVGHLSGGELQRVYLARAIARRPRLILLDEPATGMDAAGESDMYCLLEEYRRSEGCDVMMITHDWGAARYHASHVMVLNRRVAGFGEPKGTLDDETLRAAFGHIGHDHGMAYRTEATGFGRRATPDAPLAAPVAAAPAAGGCQHAGHHHHHHQHNAETSPANSEPRA